MIKNGKFLGASSVELTEFFVQENYCEGYVISIFEPLIINSDKKAVKQLLYHIPDNITESQCVIIQFKSEKDYNQFANKATDLGLLFRSFLNGKIIYDSEKK